MMESVQLGTQGLLFSHIASKPGIRYKELQRLIGLSNGVLSYPLSILARERMIRVEREMGVTRYYLPSVPEVASRLLGFLRHRPAREIIIFMLENDACTFAEIAYHAHKAPSTVSSHLKKLKEARIIHVRYGEYQLYSLANRELVADVLSMYKSTLADKIVDNYVEMLDEL